MSVVALGVILGTILFLASLAYQMGQNAAHQERDREDRFASLERSLLVKAEELIRADTEDREMLMNIANNIERETNEKFDDVHRRIEGQIVSADRRVDAVYTELLGRITALENAANTSRR